MSGSSIRFVNPDLMASLDLPRSYVPTVEHRFGRTWSSHFQDIRYVVLGTTRLLSPDMAFVSVAVFCNRSLGVAAAAWLSVASTLSLDLVVCLSQDGPYALPILIGVHGEIRMSTVGETSFGMQG